MILLEEALILFSKACSLRFSRPFMIRGIIPCETRVSRSRLRNSRLSFLLKQSEVLESVLLVEGLRFSEGEGFSISDGPRFIVRFKCLLVELI
jgi:hypothetical protein